MASLKETSTGRTNRIILQCVSDAMAKPDRMVYCYDHDPNPEANRIIAIRVSQILGVLGIQHLCEDNTVIVSPYVRPEQ